MNTQKAAKWFGIVFIAIAILGFVPGITSNGMLLGIFEVDTLHNIIHLLSGIIAIVCSSSMSNSKTYFKVFGLVYLLVTILGFIGSGSVLGLIMVNGADNLLHLVISIVSLALGFGGSKSSMSSQPMMNQ